MNIESQVVDDARVAEDGEVPPVANRPPLSRAKRFFSFLLMAAVLFGVSALVFFLRDDIIRLSRYGYIGLFVMAALSSASVLLPIPGLTLAFAVGGALNPFAVGLVIGTGAACGELTGYLAGAAGHGLIEDQAAYRRTAGWMQRYGMWAVFGLAVIPNPFFDIVGIISGVLRIPVWRFFGACWAGNVIKATVVALIGLSAFTVLGPALQRWVGK